MTVSVAYEQLGSYPASVDRLFLGQHRMPGVSSMSARDGVLPSTGVSPLSSVAVSGAMTVNVKAGSASVAGYLVTADADQPTPIDPTATTARTDIIVLRVYDSEAGDGQTLGAIEVVKGIDANPPAVPARSLLLSQVTLPAQTSGLAGAMVTDKRVYTVSRGGVLPAPGRLATAPNAAGDPFAVGQPVWDATAGALGIANGSSWAKLAPPPAGVGDMARGATASGSIPHGAWTYCSTAVDWVAGSALRGDSSGIICDTPGVYVCYIYVNFNQSNATGRRMVGISTSSSVQPSGTQMATMAAHPGSLTFQATIPMDVAIPTGQRFVLFVFQDSGAALTLGSRSIIVQKVAPAHS